MNVVVPFKEPIRDKVADWAQRITAAWRETVEGIIGVGKMLVAARNDLQNERGAWGRLIGDHGQKSQLPFGSHTAYRLIDIAADNAELDDALSDHSALATRVRCRHR
jgi:hypothetical protein